MLIDTHLHTQEHSADSQLPVREAIARAQEMGLDGLCLTDHDNMDWRDEIDALQRETRITLFLGMEYLTRDGDFVVFGLNSAPPPLLSACELLAKVAACGGFAVACHPYRNNGRGAGDRLLGFPGLFGVEAFNGSTPPLNNLQALESARRLNAPLLGAGDAHITSRVGCFATRINHIVRTVPELVAALKARAVSPVIYENNKFVDIFASDYFHAALRTRRLQSDG